MKFSDQKGITLIALVTTIIVLFIISSISIIEGTKMIEKAKAQTIETNMYTIKGKVIRYVEDVEAKNWKKSSNDKETANNQQYTGNYNFEKINDLSGYSWNTGDSVFYILTENALKKMDLEDLYDEHHTYIVQIPKDGDTQKVDIIYESGVKYNKASYYKLSDLRNVLQSD